MLAHCRLKMMQLLRTDADAMSWWHLSYDRRFVQLRNQIFDLGQILVYNSSPRR